MCRFAYLFLATILLGFAKLDSPTLEPANPFDPKADAQKLYDAIAGIGTNEANIIDVLTHRASSQRAIISTTYMNKFGHTLIIDLEGDLSGNLEDVCVSLTYSTTDFLAVELHKTVFLPGTDEASLVEVLISRSNQEIADIKTAYPKFYGVSLINDIQSDTSGPIQDLLLLLVQGSRNESTVVDVAQVMNDVISLYKAGQGSLGTEESTFVNIFAERSYYHLKTIFEQYQLKYGYSMEFVIQSEFSGNIRDGLLSIVTFARNKATYFAQRLNSSVAGAGTRDQDLMRQIISRCEKDLGDIKIEYAKIYGQSLANAVSEDTSGDYRTALLNLIA